MQIEAVQDAVLSNAEVLKHFNEEWACRELRGREGLAKTQRPGDDLAGNEGNSVGKKGGKKEGKSDRQAEDKPSSNYASMHRDLNAYFAAAQGAELPALPDYAAYPEGSTLELVKGLHKYKLTKAETIMILNLKPRDAITLDILVEELDDRFPDTGSQQGEILDVVGKALTRAKDADPGKLSLEDQEEIDAPDENDG